MTQALHVVILAAGEGKRMKSALPKVLQPVGGRPMLAHVIDTARTLEPAGIHVVYGHGGESVRAAFAGQDDLSWYEQAQRLGTGHAVQQALPGIPEAVDVLVLTPFPLPSGVVVPCRAIGILEMEDESGVDGKVLAVPTKKILPAYDKIETLDDVHTLTLQQIAHFFEHYKDLEKGKWVKVLGWKGVDAAHKEIVDGMANYQG